MKRPIGSFAEAKTRLLEIVESVNDLSDFIRIADERITAVNLLKGEAVGMGKDDLNTTDPGSWADRVFYIFTLNKKSMTPHQVMQQYDRFQWPKPPNERDFYKRIYSALHYLTTKKTSLVKEGIGEFRLKEAISDGQ